MKKVLAVVLVLSLAICFAACKKDEEDLTTTENSLTAELPSDLFSTDNYEEDDSEVMSASVEDENAASTILLTTEAGQTMPTVATTMFVPQPVATTAPGGNLTVPTMSAPSVNVSSQQSYTFSTVPGGGSVPAYIPTTRTQPTFGTTSFFAPTTTSYSPYTAVTSARPSGASATTTTTSSGVLPSLTLPVATTRATTTTAPTTTGPITRSSKTVVINDYAITADKKLVVTIDPNGWDGSFQNNSQNITVKVDGASKTAPASVKSNAKNADGYQYITIDLSELSVPDGSSVQFTIPSAFLQTTSGAQYNSAFSGAYTMM